MKNLKFILFGLLTSLLIGCGQPETKQGLSFNEMLNLTRKESLKVSPQAKFYEATTNFEVKRIKSVFRGEENTTIEISCNTKGELKTITINSPYLEDEVIHFPVQMKLEEATQQLVTSGYVNENGKADWTEVVLRRPLGPEFTFPLYIFTTSQGYVSVNTITGEVTPL